MKTTCLINNYNYETYVLDAVQSALEQTVTFDEIIVVDDGSTDGSVALLNERYSSHPIVKVIIKQNGGQLSCFQEGLHASSGDILFFLDADDLYKENYLEEALQVYENLKCDFLFCGHKDFTDVGEEQRIRQIYNQTLDLGYSVILATWAEGNQYIGNVTSTLSIKREFLARLFPYPFMSDWRIQADVYLIFGSSMAGARKAYHNQPLVMRRIHGRNWYAKEGYGSNSRAALSDSKRYADNLRRSRFKQILVNKLGIDQSLIRYVNNEFRTIDNPTKDIMHTYIKIVDKANFSFIEGIKKKISIYRHYFSRGETKDSKKSMKAEYIAKKF